MADAQSVLEFWLTELTPAEWYRQDDALDAKIRDRFMETWRAAKMGQLEDWLDTPEGALALLIVLDQFPRNMFRGHADAFSTDLNALKTAKKAIDAGLDMKVDEPERQFFYLPLMHAENMDDQRTSCLMIASRMPDTGAYNAPHAEAHKACIERFGRFPGRNAALGRRTTDAEADYLENGGYAKDLEAAKGELS